MKNVNWPNSDIITDENIYLNHRFQMIGGNARVYNGTTLERQTGMVSWTYEGNHTYHATSIDGSVWVVRKQNCNCGPNKL